jgi:predicted ATPase
MQGHQMSEGMTSYLCLLAAILSPEATAAIAFDEPDAHLHPSAMRRLVYLLEKASERTAVFVATHSDRFLDYLSDPSGSLRVCEPKDGGVTVQSLNREALDEWRKSYSLSELRGRGYLDTSNASTAEI